MNGKLLILPAAVLLLVLGAFLWWLFAVAPGTAEPPAPPEAVSTTEAPAGEAPAPSPTPGPAPTPAPEPTPEPTAAERLLGEMSLEEKLWQLLVVRPGDLVGLYPVKSLNAAEIAVLRGYPAGGFFLDAGNMEDSEQLKALTAALVRDAEVAPLVLCDEEGGTVARLMNTVGTTRIGSMYSYREEGRETAFQNAETIGRDLLEHGLNADLAPVADVWSNPANTVIHTRAYSDDFQQAAELVAAAVEGFHAGGVACTLKHFPGHGDTAEDSHNGAAYVHKDLDRLREEELLPFRAGIEAGADMVMIGHLTVPALDDLPAPFSPAIVEGLLRGELGFSGVAITDSLAMGALKGYGEGEAALLALEAGVDLLLCPGDPISLVDFLAAAAAAGELSEERVDESVLRILSMKEARGLL